MVTSPRVTCLGHSLILMYTFFSAPSIPCYPFLVLWVGVLAAGVMLKHYCHLIIDWLRDNYDLVDVIIPLKYTLKDLYL